MRTFQQFSNLCEAYFDPNVQGRSQVQRVGSDGSKIGADRKKTAPERRRSGKAVGGGKTAPVKDYKPRSDIGTQRKTSTRVQQPTRERGSAALSAKEAQKKAYRERKARESGTKTKTASQLLSKKPQSKYYVSKSKTSSEYKPSKGVAPASGPSKKAYTTKERKALYKKGERTLRDIRLKHLGKKSEKELKHRVTSK